MEQRKLATDILEDVLVGLPSCANPNHPYYADQSTSKVHCCNKAHADALFTLLRDAGDLVKRVDDTTLCLEAKAYMPESQDILSANLVFDELTNLMDMMNPDAASEEIHEIAVPTKEAGDCIVEFFETIAGKKSDKGEGFMCVLLPDDGSGSPQDYVVVRYG